ncbi:MAG TPA: glycosyltransferase [Nitrococcus sp.]|nr:glycosyltransferase [Nitrococcus sp.]
MEKRALLIAYHFPPLKVSSGLQRTLKFARYLSDYGWHPTVLSAHPRAFEAVSSEQLSELPADVEVYRGFALDARRHLSLGGRYSRLLAVPDRWSAWWLGGVITGLRLIRRLRPQILWSTYPIATAHLIGLTLQRLTGLPWVADFRDPMTDDDYPPEPLQWRAHRWVERQSIRHCAAAVFTTPGAHTIYLARYAELTPERAVVIANGYDEENFVRAAVVRRPATGARTLTLLHSGVLYPQERDPRSFFEALALLKQRGTIRAGELRVVLRATGHDEHHRRAIDAAGVAELVALAPPLAYEQALREMLEADALLLFQAANCNQQIPAKLYEYFRAGRPVFALTDAAGDTAAALREAGIDTIVPLDDAPAIATGLARFLERLALDQAPSANPAVVDRYSRYALTGELAALFDLVAQNDSAVAALRSRHDA